MTFDEFLAYPPVRWIGAAMVAVLGLLVSSIVYVFHTERQRVNAQFDATQRTQHSMQDELTAMDSRLRQVEQEGAKRVDVHDLRDEMQAQFTSLRAELSAWRAELIALLRSK